MRYLLLGQFSEGMQKGEFICIDHNGPDVTISVEDPTKVEILNDDTDGDSNDEYVKIPGVLTEITAKQALAEINNICPEEIEIAEEETGDTN